MSVWAWEEEGKTHEEDAHDASDEDGQERQARLARVEMVALDEDDGVGQEQQVHQAIDKL